MTDEEFRNRIVGNVHRALGLKQEETPARSAEPDGMLAYALALEIQDRNDPSWPLPSFDARDWAQAFVELVKKKPEIATDEATMTTWFAGALMRGHDERVRRERQMR